MYIDRGDSIQASEKLYKVAGNSVKILARLAGLEEYREAQAEGSWWTKLLDRAARSLRCIYGEEILDAWDSAYKLHQKGFHEEMLSVDDVIGVFPKIEMLVMIVENELKRY